ncbi:DUF47 domain-containing protein [Mucilaginibacter aquatilis]|uniref:DUF47 family protein n=1 Tax=Mucilaginibacter aquatilis TaxID=1517760 RepID=A0A6I4IPP9_9SPHI|nr:DUF47 family protein [Mucilaginibacter aquatilis]MVN89704.1 DUF47 family protein [Mucilaginibacter aquatilis]
MSSVLSKFLPDNDQLFFGLFDSAAANCATMAKLLNEAVQGKWEPEQKTEFAQISRLKTHSAEIKRQVYYTAGKALVSPFERTDIYDLASAISAASDYVDSSARRINLYSLSSITPPMLELCGIINEAAQQAQLCLKALRNLSDREAITTLCTRIKQLEHDADDVYDRGFAQLNAHETDSIQLIKHSEILGALERTTDKFEDIAFVVESILVKNS